MNSEKISGFGKSSLRILHAEDSDDCAALVRRAVKLAGFADPLRFTDGEKAIGHLAECDKATRPHVILLDLNMPIKDGFDVLGWVRSRQEYKSIPVVMLTTSTEAADIERARELGATRYLQKEGSYRAVVQLLEEFLRALDSN